MDRQLIYAGQIPLDTDLLNTNKNAMVALGKLAGGLLGLPASTGLPQVVNGLAVGQTGPASMNVQVGPGEIYALRNVDDAAYGSLALDTTDQVIKQGIVLGNTLLSCPAPTGAGNVGFSINYLVQAAFSEADTGLVALPYYNASNPTQAWSGPNNSGTPQATLRQGQCLVTVKPGAAALTGTQTTPSPDANNIGLAVVTVAYGQASITSSSISQYSGASLVPPGGMASGVAHAILFKDVTGSVDVTLSAQEAAYPILVLTGAIGANINVIVPATNRQRIIDNRASGSYTITCKTPSGTGVAVAASSTTVTYCDGTNVKYGNSSALQASQLNVLTKVGSQTQVSSDLSPLFRGSQGTILSGAAYVLNGNIQIMEAVTHNCSIDTSGNFSGVFETGIATAEFWGEDDVLRVFTAPSVGAGTVPTFGATPTYQLDMKTGASSLNGLMPTYKNLKISSLGLNNYNCTITADKVVLESSSGFYYGVESVNLTVNANGTVGAPLSIMSARAASTWYYVWLWYNATAGLTATLDASNTAPTAPTGYVSTDYKALLPGARRTDSSGSMYLLQLLTRDRFTQYVVLGSSNVPNYPSPISGVQGNPGAGTYVAGALGSFIPTATAKVLHGMLNIPGSSVAMVSPNNQTGAVNSTTNPPMLGAGTATGAYGSTPFVWVLEDTNIYYASTGASCGAFVTGWED